MKTSHSEYCNIFLIWFEFDNLYLYVNFYAEYLDWMTIFTLYHKIQYTFVDMTLRKCK